MPVVRLVVLLFLVAYSFSMGQTPASGLNAFGKFASSLFFIVTPILYMLPTVEGTIKKHENLTALAITNLFLGWTFLGWVFAYVWAFKKPVVNLQEPPQRPEAAQDVAAELKTCPFCAEKVLAAAIKCKHCGSSLT